MADVVARNADSVPTADDSPPRPSRRLFDRAAAMDESSRSGIRQLFALFNRRCGRNPQISRGDVPGRRVSYRTALGTKPAIASSRDPGKRRISSSARRSSEIEAMLVEPGSRGGEPRGR